LSLKSDKIDKGSKTMSCNNLVQFQQRHKHEFWAIIVVRDWEKEGRGGPMN